MDKRVPVSVVCGDERMVKHTHTSTHAHTDVALSGARRVLGSQPHSHAEASRLELTCPSESPRMDSRGCVSRLGLPPGPGPALPLTDRRHGAGKLPEKRISEGAAGRFA